MSSNRADVEIRLPADSAYLSVLRTTTAGLAARLDFTLDDIEDLRIAVDEASSMVLPQADPESDLHCQFFMDPSELTVTVSVECQAPNGLDEDGFGWQVLHALTSTARAEAADGLLSIVLSRKSGHGS